MATKKLSARSAHAEATKKTAGKKAANPCWSGYESTPGKKPFTKGSCKPKAAKKKSA